MPARSKAQFNLMQAVAHGDAKLPGLSPAKAAELVQGQSPKGLPMVKLQTGTRTTDVGAMPMSTMPGTRTPTTSRMTDHQRISHHMTLGNGVHSSGKGRR